MLLPGDGIQRLNQKRLPVKAGGSLNGEWQLPEGEKAAPGSMEANMEVTIYKPDFTMRYGKRLAPSTVLDYVKQEYTIDENLTDRDIKTHHEGDYERAIIESN